MRAYARVKPIKLKTAACVPVAGHVGQNRSTHPRLHPALELLHEGPVSRFEHRGPRIGQAVHRDHGVLVDGHADVVESRIEDGLR